MTHVDPVVAESLERVFPVPAVIWDWDDVLERARAGKRRRSRVRPPRSVVWRVAVVGAAAVAVATAALVAGTLTGRPRVLERAQAALDPNGRILHIVSRQVDDRTTLLEAWALPDGSLDHVVIRSGTGAFGADCVGSQTQARCWNPRLNVIDVYRYPPPEPGFPRDEPQFRLDEPETLGRALGSGYARLLGDTTFAGRPVVAVLLAVWVGTGNGEVLKLERRVSPTVYLDRKTYYPVALRDPDGWSTVYYETFEFLPNTAENRALVELPASKDARVVVHPVGEYPPEGKGPPGPVQPTKRGR
jgi:hypothetical protein